jgi:hypothetical protein
MWSIKRIINRYVTKCIIIIIIIIENNHTGHVAPTSKIKSSPITGLDWPRGFQEVEAPRFQDNRHMKMVKVVSPTHRSPLPPRKYSWYSFLLEAASTPEP